MPERATESTEIVELRRKGLCIFIKSNTGERYNIGTFDWTLSVGGRRFSKDEYDFLYDPKNRELLIYYHVDGRKEFKPLGFVEQTAEAGEIVDDLTS